MVFALPTLDQQGTMFVRVGDILSIEVDKVVLPSPATSRSSAPESAIIVDDFLRPETNEALMTYIRDREGSFIHSTITDRSSGLDVVNKEQRISSVLVDKGPTLWAFIDVVRKTYPRILSKLGLAAFPEGQVEVQITASGHGAFFGRHTDNSASANEGRFLTFVYYLHAMPQRFQGGALTLYKDGVEESRVEPVNNSIIFFPSRLEHEVGLVTCDDELFESSRFTINGWIHRS